MRRLALAAALAIWGGPAVAAAGKTDIYRSALVNKFFRGVSLSFPSTLTARLYSTCPTASTSGTELSGSGYSPPTVNADTSAWAAASAGATSNLGTLSFGTASANWAGVNCIGLENGGTLYMWGSVVGAPVSVIAGETARIAVGALQASEVDNGTNLTETKVGSFVISAGATTASVSDLGFTHAPKLVLLAAGRGSALGGAAGAQQSFGYILSTGSAYANQGAAFWRARDGLDTTSISRGPNAGYAVLVPNDSTSVFGYAATSISATGFTLTIGSGSTPQDTVVTYLAIYDPDLEVVAGTFTPSTAGAQDVTVTGLSGAANSLITIYSPSTSVAASTGGIGVGIATTSGQSAFGVRDVTGVTTTDSQAFSTSSRFFGWPGTTSPPLLFGTLNSFASGSFNFTQGTITSASHVVIYLAMRGLSVSAGSFATHTGGADSYSPASSLGFTAKAGIFFTSQRVDQTTATTVSDGAEIGIGFVDASLNQRVLSVLDPDGLTGTPASDNETFSAEAVYANRSRTGANTFATTSQTTVTALGSGLTVQQSAADDATAQVGYILIGR